MDFEPINYGNENEYPKLVRDKIPEIIKAEEGVTIEQKILTTDQEFLEYLLEKIVEKSLELRDSATENNLEEELADIFEIIDTVLKLRNRTTEDIVAIQKEKREKRGGFEKRILMLAKTKK